jgi:mRNA-degrading endonuclease RelE of RelBE toxin-antitoxin system
LDPPLFILFHYSPRLTGVLPIESQHRKKLRANPVAPWELRFGKYRVFYELVNVTTIKIVAIGYKEHNDLFIRGRRVKL